MREVSWVRPKQVPIGWVVMLTRLTRHCMDEIWAAWRFWRKRTSEEAEFEEGELAEVAVEFEEGEETEGEESEAEEEESLPKIPPRTVWMRAARIVIKMGVVTRILDDCESSSNLVNLSMNKLQKTVNLPDNILASSRLSVQGG